MSRMDRMEALQVLKRHITNEIVVGTYSTGFDWASITERPLNYFAVGAMGLGSSHGLGLALARPERKIVVLDGDGGLLMNLGTLVTIGKVAPKNLVHFVFKNNTYEANGGHPIPNTGVDFETIARGAGIPNVATCKTVADFEKNIANWLTIEGPTFVCMEIEQGWLGRRDYSNMYSASRRQALKEALAAGA